MRKSARITENLFSVIDLIDDNELQEIQFFDNQQETLYDIIRIDCEFFNNHKDEIKKKLSPYSFAKRQKEDYIERSVANHYWIILKGNEDKVKKAKEHIYSNWSPIIDNIVIYSQDDENVHNTIYEDMLNTCFPYKKSIAKDYLEDIINGISNNYEDSGMNLKILRHLSWVTAIFANKFELQHDSEKGSSISKELLKDLNQRKIDYTILSYFRDLLYRLAFERYPHEYILIEANKLKSVINQNNYFEDE